MSAQSVHTLKQLRNALIQFLITTDFNDVPMDSRRAEEYIDYIDRQQRSINATDSELCYQYARIMILRLKVTV